MSNWKLKKVNTSHLGRILIFGQVTPSSESLSYLSPDNREFSLTSLANMRIDQHVCPHECFEQFRRSSIQEYKKQLQFTRLDEQVRKLQTLMPALHGY